MSILYDKTQKTLTLHTENTTLPDAGGQVWIPAASVLRKRADGCMDYLLTFYDRGFSGNPYDAGKDKTYSMDALPQNSRRSAQEITGHLPVSSRIQTALTAVISGM